MLALESLRMFVSERERNASRTSSDARVYAPVCALAQGGMGMVEVAVRREGTFRRLYAVKRLHEHLRTDPEFRAMFLDEARIAGLIEHPNVVSVLDVGTDARGPYLVMDYIEGLALSSLIAGASKRQIEFPVQVAVRIALEVARGLHAAHEVKTHDGRSLDLVHRDLSPHNVLVGYSGAVRITDFGIAKALGQSVHTQTAVIKGKIAYMSPEALMHERLDRRADLFALGIVLFEMLAGRRLYAGPEAAKRILHEPPPDIGELRDDVPPELVELSFALLAKEREERPRDALEVARSLEAILVGLLGSDATLDLGQFVELVAGAERRARQTELAARLSEVGASPAARPKLARALYWIAGAVALVLAATTTTFYVLGGSEDPLAGELRAVDSSRGPPARAASTAPPAPGGVSAAVVAPEPASADEASAPRADQADANEAARAERGRRVARRRRESAMADAPTAVRSMAAVRESTRRVGWGGP
jgi:tRNA A-37 threonylcarbamoyl transferase component Bud32